MAILKVVCYSAGSEQEALMLMLTADIGGTNSRFSMFSIEGRKPVYKCGVVISSKEEEFSHLLNKLFTCWPVEWTELARVSLVVVAAAGPVRDGRIEMTNADFAVEEDQIRSFFPDSEVLLMNDFEAQAWACLSPVIDEAERVLSCEGAEAPVFSGAAPVAVVGAGTGLGAAWLMPGGEGGPRVLPSEAGHMSFPFDVRDEQEKAFAAFLAGDGTLLSTAGHVLSGSGLARLHEFFTGKTENPAYFTQLPSFPDSDTCRLFARFYGRFCRMAALSLLPQAVVIAGGVAEKTPSLVRHEEFAHEFRRAAGAHGDFLSQVPVWLNRHPQSGLWGAAEAGAMLAHEAEQR